MQKNRRIHLSRYSMKDLPFRGAKVRSDVSPHLDLTSFPISLYDGKSAHLLIHTNKGSVEQLPDLRIRQRSDQERLCVVSDACVIFQVTGEMHDQKHTLLLFGNPQGLFVIGIPIHSSAMPITLRLASRTASK